MLETFANWALVTYGDAAKTKTVTRQKYERIIDILKSESRDENSKFRFWVKSKGFFLATLDGEEVLCVPDFKAGAEASDLKAAGESYKRVAFVEDFFSIIYREHVRGDGRHVGQKRTYRAVSERYSFLPREAVSKFLSMCEVCQLRMQNSLSPGGHLGPGSKRKIDVTLSVESSPENKGDEASLNNGNGSEEKPESFDEACSPKSDKSSSSVSGECSSKGDRDDEDDDDDDEEIDKNNRSVDPERLKAFNMFVRLFVDENLDRFVPISKQPKEKIQAIIDSCARQFPEFEDRARKRIRTYLKSCRRGFKRNKDGEQSRPPSTQLNSVAESILASACENEASNAKRMRMGLDPIVYQADKTNSKSQTATASVDSNSLNLLQREDCFRFPFRPPDIPLLNGGGLFRPGAFPPPPFPLTTPPSLVPSHLVSNGSSDFKMKSLSSAEQNAIKQMVAGFRESAAFLTRSAEELESLLQQQS